MKSFLTLVVILLTTIAGFGQTKKTDTLVIKTSAECDMCKTSIEKALMYEKGVKSANLDVDSKVLTVVYKPAKITPDKIREVINQSGYDADDKPANNKAYEKLNSCCKKGAHKK